MAQTTQSSSDSVSVQTLANEPNPSTGAKENSWKELIEIPRWVVYFQAALLGLIATTFFIFGVMVGNLTSNPAARVNALIDCRVIGSVVYRVDGALHADEGAVVILLPQNRKPESRYRGELVNPDSFKPLDNEAIDQIHQLGGAVVRADENGQFDVMVDANKDNAVGYYLLIVSNHQRADDAEQMTKEQFASIGTFFSPVEEVVDDRAFHWMKVSANSQRIDLPQIEM